MTPTFDRRIRHVQAEVSAILVENPPPSAGQDGVCGLLVRLQGNADASVPPTFVLQVYERLPYTIRLTVDESPPTLWSPSE
jgi:hypothetical protein